MQEGQSSKKITLPSILAVGDSLPHDIQGAINSGIQSAFITDGVHADEFHFNDEQAGDHQAEACKAAFRRHLDDDAAPTHVMASFKW